MTGTDRAAAGAAIDAATTIETTRFEGAGSVLECFVVPWDTAAFGFPVAEISRFEIGADDGAAGPLADLDAWCQERAIRLVSCRLDHTRLRESIALEGLGFRFIEMVYGPHLDDLANLEAPRHAIRIEEASRDDLAAIEAIAADAFTTGRYLLDPRLDPEHGRRRYERWVRSSLDHPRQTLLKAAIGDQPDDQPVGFFIVEDHPDGSVYWHLTAVAQGWQGRGIGRSLWQAMLERHRAAGVTSVRTTISAHNEAVINLYARLGFRFGSPRMTFHWLREPVA
jgi:ribosomal protein S18 acetylase RimI-like enzyme